MPERRPDPTPEGDGARATRAVDATQVPAETGRDRLAQAIRKPTRRQLGVAVILAVLGFSAAVQLRSTEAATSYPGMRQEDLVQVLNNLSAAAQRAENDINQLEQAQQSLLSNRDSRSAAIARAREQADALAILAGTVPASGPGIRVTVTDESGQMKIDQLLNALQELRDAGAEAIELNDAVRVVAQTALDDGSAAGETPGRIIVDGQELAQPYVIEAIGNPETLATALGIFGGFLEQVEQVSARAVVERLEDVEIASVREIATAEYATPVEDE